VASTRIRFRPFAEVANMANDVSGTTDETLRQEENSKDMNSNKRQLISTNFYLKMKN